MWVVVRQHPRPVGHIRTPVFIKGYVVDIGLSRCRFVQEPTEVEEVLLRRQPLFQRGIAPLGDKGVRRHAEVLAWRGQGSPSRPRWRRSRRA